MRNNLDQIFSGFFSSVVQMWCKLSEIRKKEKRNYLVFK